MMVMIHNGDRRCPFCYSKKLKVTDNGIADPSYHERFGKFWFQLTCTKCFGVCEDINNADLSEKRAKAKALKKQAEEVTA